MQYPVNDQPGQSYPYPQQQSQSMPPQQYPYGAPPMQQYPYGTPMQSQPPKKRRGRTWAIIGGIIVFLIIVAAAASTGGQGSRSNVSNPSEPTAQVNQGQPTQDAQPAGGHRVNEPVVISGWTVTVNSVKYNSGDGEFNVPKAGHVYLFIDVTAVNNTGQSQDVSSLGQFSLKDSTGQSYTETIDTAAPAAPNGTIASGSKVRGTLVYEVPASTNRWELDFQPGLFDTDQAVWSLTI